MLALSALVQEKSILLAKIKNLEKETSIKPFRGDRDRAHDDLRSKLKAAESLCESLMDENEDMKKEIRQLEEEIYELQDNFRYYIFVHKKYYVFHSQFALICMAFVGFCREIYNIVFFFSSYISDKINNILFYMLLVLMYRSKV